jgi:cyclic pyranopterin monophosphate synthase
MSKKQLNQARGMVDITDKDVTLRTARASGVIRMSSEAIRALENGQSPKGSVLDTARVAAVMAAKATPAIVPMCHPLELGKVMVDFSVDRKKSLIRIFVEVNYRGRTGVEMEALMAVSVAALTIYDMMKWKDPSMKITDVALDYKSGGKKGIYQRA